MLFDLTCRDATRLVLEGEDRSLSRAEWFGLHFHLLICKYCPPFVRQVRLMRSAVGRWQRYAESESDAPPER